MAATTGGAGDSPASCQPEHQPAAHDVAACQRQLIIASRTSAAKFITVEFTCRFSVTFIIFLFITFTAAFQHHDTTSIVFTGRHYHTAVEFVTGIITVADVTSTAAAVTGRDITTGTVGHAELML